MSKDRTVFKLLQDQDFADGRTIGQMNTQTEGRPKVPSKFYLVGFTHSLSQPFLPLQEVGSVLYLFEIY